VNRYLLILALPLIRDRPESQSDPDGSGAMSEEQPGIVVAEAALSGLNR